MDTNATHIGNRCHGCACKHTCTDTHTHMCARTHTHTHMCARTHTHTPLQTHVKYRSVHARVTLLQTIHLLSTPFPRYVPSATIEKRANMAHNTNRTTSNMTRGDTPPRLEQGRVCRERGQFSSIRKGSCNTSCPYSHVEGRS